MARVSKSILPFRLLVLFFFAAPALISILGSRVVVSADSLYRRRLLIEDHTGPAIYRRKFLGIDKIEPRLGNMSGLPGAIANLGLMLWGQKAKPVDKTFTEAGGFAEPTVYTKRSPGGHKPVDTSFTQAGGFAPATVYTRGTSEGPQAPVLCVSGLSSTTKKHDLGVEFTKCGSVAHVNIWDVGKPTAHALVTMTNPEDVERCAKMLDHSDLQGHQIVVHESGTRRCEKPAETVSPKIS